MTTDAVVPDQTICLVDGKVNVGEPCTLLDLKRMMDSYPRDAHREMKAAIDELLDSLDIENPKWKPPAMGAFMFTFLCEKAPADQNAALVQTILQTLCSGVPDLLLSAMFVSIAKGTLWADNSFYDESASSSGKIVFHFPKDPRFSKDGAWIGGPPRETKAKPELN